QLGLLFNHAPDPIDVCHRRRSPRCAESPRRLLFHYSFRNPRVDPFDSPCARHWRSTSSTRNGRLSQPAKAHLAKQQAVEIALLVHLHRFRSQRVTSQSPPSSRKGACTASSVAAGAESLAPDSIDLLLAEEPDSTDLFEFISERICSRRECPAIWMPACCTSAMRPSTELEANSAWPKALE